MQLDGGFVGRTHRRDLDQVVHDRKPGETIVLGPLGLGSLCLQMHRPDRGPKTKDRLWVPNFMDKPLLVCVDRAPAVGKVVEPGLQIDR